MVGKFVIIFCLALAAYMVWEGCALGSRTGPLLVGLKSCDWATVTRLH